jgi:hypothetical protein
MRLYIYFNKFDSSQEPHGIIEAANITEAIKRAAEIKRMDIDTFTQVFDVKTLKNGKSKI